MSLAAACSSISSSRVALGSRQAAFLPAQRPAAGGRRRAVAAPTAALDPANVTAVTQMSVAYAAVLGGEAAFTGLSTAASTPGRPTVPQTVAGVVLTLGAAAGASQDGFVCTAGCAVGALAGAAMLSIMIQRALQTPFNPNDFPGAKAWPATMGLISFFSLAVFWQALVAALK